MPLTQNNALTQIVLKCFIAKNEPTVKIDFYVDLIKHFKILCN